MNRPKLNKNIWLKSKVDSLNVLADELNQCRQKLAMAQKLHISDNLELIYNSEVKEIETELEGLCKDFCAEYLTALANWGLMKDE